MEDFSSELRKESVQYDRAIKIDGVDLKVQGKHLYDFTLHLLLVGRYLNQLFHEVDFIED